MQTQQMRTEVTKAYSGPSWPEKVRKMSDNQVQAVYFRLKKAGIIK